MVSNDRQSATDEELAQLVLQDASAFDVLMQRYEEKLLRYVHRSTNVDSHEAQDLLQDAFLKAYTNIASFDSAQSFNSWIYRIAHNVIISAYRKRKARPVSVIFPEDDEGVDRLIADVNVMSEVDRSMTRDHIRLSLDALSDKYRVPLELFYFEGKSIQEISDILKKPMGSVGTLMRRGKEKFSKQYQKRGEGVEEEKRRGLHDSFSSDSLL